MNVVTLNPTTSFIPASGKPIPRREALIITHPFKAVLDPIVFWGKAKTGPVMYTSPLGITVTVNPNHITTVTLKKGITAVKVAVGKTWKDVVAIPFPLVVGVRLKSNGKTISVPTKFYLKDGASKGRKYVRVSLSKKIVPGKNGELNVSMHVKKRRKPRRTTKQPVVIIKKKKSRS